MSYSSHQAKINVIKQWTWGDCNEGFFANSHGQLVKDDGKWHFMGEIVAKKGGH